MDASANQGLATTKTPNQNKLKDNKQNSLLRAFILSGVFVALVFIIFGALVGWLLYRVDTLEKQLIQTNGELLNVSTDLGYFKAATSSEISSINNRIDQVDSAASRNISILQDQLDYVIPLAENGNLYAHSHNTWSDASLKTDLQHIGDPLERVLALQGVTYVWTPGAQAKLGLGGETEIGLIAQDVERVFPELVWVDDAGYKHVDYGHLAAVLLEAMREQQAQIDLLQNRISGLEMNH